MDFWYGAGQQCKYTFKISSERDQPSLDKIDIAGKLVVIGSQYPVMIYSDHEALKLIFATGKTEKGCIASWLDFLGYFDYKIMRSSQDQHIGIADGLNRMPTRSLDDANQDLPNKLATPLLDVNLVLSIVLREINRISLEHHITPPSLY